MIRVPTSTPRGSAAQAGLLGDRPARLPQVPDREDQRGQQYECDNERQNRGTCDVPWIAGPGPAVSDVPSPASQHREKSGQPRDRQRVRG